MATSAIQAAYATARRVYSGELAPSEGCDNLNANHGINRNSARDLIYAYKHLMRGEVFHRGLSAPDMHFFLSRIYRDNGPVALRLALQSLWTHIAYYEGIRTVTLRKLRGVAERHEARAARPIAARLLLDDFAEAVNRSIADSASSRARRLRKAPKIPKRIPVLGVIFERNPDVVAEVLLHAKGRCARCGKKAPFMRRSDGTPYLEVHHIIQLADGGEDTVENAQALCPNCHRESHFGQS